MRKKRNKYKTRSDTSTKKKKTVRRKVAAAKRQKAAKTRNAGTMTDAQFFQMIRHVLRRRTIFWKPILNVKNRAKIAYKGPNKRRKFSFICEGCKEEFASNQVNVHHMVECGSLMTFDDLPGFVERLFCEEEHLKLLCHRCHDLEHLKEKE